MLEYLTVQEVEKMIRDNNYPCFKLFYKAAANYDAFKLFKTHVPESLAVAEEKPPEPPVPGKKKKSVKTDATPQMIDETIAVLHNNLSIYKDKPGYLFMVELRYSALGTGFGPFIFSYDELPAQSAKGLNGNHLPDFKSSDDYIDFRIAKSTLQRDIKEFHQRKAELDAQTRDFEEIKLRPASRVASAALLYAFDVISKNVLNIDSNLSGMPVKDGEDGEEKSSGTEDDDTQAASDLANDLIASGLSADQIKELHRVAKEKLIPNLKSNGNKDQETD